MSATCSQAKEAHHSAQPSISTTVRGPGMRHVTCHAVTGHVLGRDVTCEVSGGLYDDWEGQQPYVGEALDQDLALARSLSHCSTMALGATCSVAM